MYTPRHAMPCTRYAHAMHTPCTRYAHVMHMHLRELAERLVLRAAAVREVRADNVEARAYAVVLQLRLPHVHRTPCYCGFASRAIALRFGYWNAPLPHNFWPALTVSARRRYSRSTAAAYGPHYTACNGTCSGSWIAWTTGAGKASCSSISSHL